MTGVGDDSRGRLAGRPWFLVGLVLALGATVALVLADDIRYLRLGIVAALWAALVGAFLAVKYRKHVSSTEEAVAQAQEVYELELEREIAARREFELEIEAESRSRAENQSRAELDALRAEVMALRDNLQSLFGGEVLLERVALTAQATRMRSLGEDKRLVESSSGRAQITAVPAREVAAADRPTELIERVREKQPARASRPAAPEPRRPERSLDLPPRRMVKNESTRVVRTSVAASVAKAAAEARAEQTGQRKPVSPPPGKPRRPEPADSLRPAFGPPERPRQPEPPKPGPAEQPTQLSKALDPEWTDGWQGKGIERTAAGLPAVTKDAGNVLPQAPEPAPVVKAPQRTPEAPKPSGGSQALPLPEPPKAPQPAAVDEEAAVSNPTLPEEVRRRAQEGRRGGRRRRAAEDAEALVTETPLAPAAPADHSAGGRRHRADGEQPSWQAPGGHAAGSHAKPEAVEEPVAEEPDAGSHSAGRSVSDLLAAHGAKTDAIPRRRRRAVD
ncbi:hypothetical protein ORV05_35615 [Amycolatopsis cynarae]|uniref:DUF6779 domain-containing protein n=1 Tax=Amycolatopsis cynarae TaxID=2995223 RepID=A0ABY7B4E7_9PSEU|nr:DUF6779 domain-containing protein [Amycolatopsis sp. HUAS 11-8]WAL66112.1 hypothetical protein ORV05_35615 [Amycolatopsis sp. HUAS 11-8]